MVCFLKQFSIDMEILMLTKWESRRCECQYHNESQANDSWLEASGDQVSFHLWMVYDGNKHECLVQVERLFDQ